MNRLHYFFVAALIVASILFLATLQHHHTKNTRDLTYAKVVSSITDAVLSDLPMQSSKTPQLVPDRGAITERRAIIISIAFSIFLCLLVIILAYSERVKRNKKDFQLQLIAASVILGIAFPALAIRFGIL